MKMADLVGLTLVLNYAELAKSINAKAFQLDWLHCRNLLIPKTKNSNPSTGRAQGVVFSATSVVGSDFKYL